MRLLVRASTVRSPSLSPPQPRIYGIGLQGTSGRATAAALGGGEALGYQGTAGSAQALMVRSGEQGTSGSAKPFIRAFGRQGTAGFTTADGQIVYAYDRALVDERHEDLTASTIANYVQRFRLQGDWLKSTANGGRIRHASAFDLIFETIATPAVRLNHEIESYDGTAGELWAVVRVPSWVTTDQFKWRVKLGADL